MFSQSSDNPWSHWVESHRAQCTYRAVPLYEAPAQCSADSKTLEHLAGLFEKSVRFSHPATGEKECDITLPAEWFDLIAATLRSALAARHAERASDSAGKWESDGGSLYLDGVNVFTTSLTSSQADLLAKLVADANASRSSPAEKAGDDYNQGYNAGVEWATKQYSQPATSPAVIDRNAVIEECAKVLDDAAQDWNRIRDPGMANQARKYARHIRELAGRSQPVTVSEDNLTSFLLPGYVHETDARREARIILSAFNVTRKPTEEPRG